MTIEVSYRLFAFDSAWVCRLPDTGEYYVVAVYSYIRWAAIGCDFKKIKISDPSKAAEAIREAGVGFQSKQPIIEYFKRKMRRGDPPRIIATEQDILGAADFAIEQLWTLEKINDLQEKHLKRFFVENVEAIREWFKKACMLGVWEHVEDFFMPYESFVMDPMTPDELVSYLFAVYIGQAVCCFSFQRMIEAFYHKFCPRITEVLADTSEIVEPEPEPEPEPDPEDEDKPPQIILEGQFWKRIDDGRVCTVLGTQKGGILLQRPDGKNGIISRSALLRSARQIDTLYG